MHPGTLVLMTRSPRAGATKTRLIPALGAEGAAQLAAAFLDDLVERFGSFPIANRVLAWADHGPAAGEERPGFQTHLQGSGDLGARMVRLHRALEGPVVFMGSDAPTLPAAAVSECLELLEAGAPVVLQPAVDGGFTLAGLGGDPEALFTAIPWGTPRVLDTVLERAELLPLEVRLLEPWYDVDEAADLSRLRDHLRTLKGQEMYAARTAATIERILETKA